MIDPWQAPSTDRGIEQEESGGREEQPKKKKAWMIGRVAACRRGGVPGYAPGGWGIPSPDPGGDCPPKVFIIADAPH